MCSTPSRVRQMLEMRGIDESEGEEMKRILGVALAVIIAAALYAAAVPDGKRWWSYVQVLVCKCLQTTT